jgi:hypothetical protein
MEQENIWLWPYLDVVVTIKLAGTLQKILTRKPTHVALSL